MPAQAATVPARSTTGDGPNPFSWRFTTPLFIGSATNHPAMPGFRGPDDLFGPTDPARMQGRRRLLNELDPAAGDGAERDWQALHRRAFELADGPGGRQVFELEREPARVRDRYGRHPL